MIVRREFLILFFMISGPPGLARKFLLFSADLRQYWYSKNQGNFVKITVKRSTNIFKTKSSQAANLPLDNGRFKSFCYRTVPQLVLNATNYELHVNVSFSSNKI